MCACVCERRLNGVEKKKGRFYRFLSKVIARINPPEWRRRVDPTRAYTNGAWIEIKNRNFFQRRTKNNIYRRNGLANG